jgi:hypothetical protein
VNRYVRSVLHDAVRVMRPVMFPNKRQLPSNCMHGANFSQHVSPRVGPLAVVTMLISRASVGSAVFPVHYVNLVA